MPVVHETKESGSRTAVNTYGRCFENGKADIHCIASLAYRQKINEAKGQYESIYRFTIKVSCGLLLIEGLLIGTVLVPVKTRAKLI